MYLRHRRSAQGRPMALPGTFLKRKWRDWKPKSKYGRVDGAEGRSRSGSTAYNPTDQPSAAAGVDRNTSIRSIMTLPAYAPAPRETEQVIGREGERAGMDVVVEFPETQDEEEVRREGEMESLYQIRLQRRREIAEREERRRARREARENNDWARLEELRRDSRRRADSQATVEREANASVQNLDAAAMIAEHNSRGRDRRISEVTYASVGHVRHDGTRLRANSNESDNRPLLDSAASMSGVDQVYTESPPPSRPSSFLGGHSHAVSSTSIMSQSTTWSEEMDELTPQTTSREHSGSDPRTPSSRSGVGSRFATSTGGDIGDSQIPMPEPPQYEDHSRWGEAPPYEGPEDRGAPQLPALQTLPSIEVTTSTPNPSAPPTPINREGSVRSQNGR